MLNTNKQNGAAFGLLWTTPIVLIFLAGGFLQYVGILSQTQTNWLSLLFLSHVFVRSSSLAQIKYEILLFIFLIFVALDTLNHRLPISYTATYFYYIACTIIAAIAGRVYASRVASLVSTRSFFRIAKIFLPIELAFVIFQRLFTDVFISYSRAPIGRIDAIFGTFYLQSDAALAAVCELLTIASFLLSSRRSDRIIISSLSLAIILLGNSNAAKIAFMLIMALLLANNIYRSLYGNRYQLTLILVAVTSPLILLMYSPLSTLISDFLAQAMDEYYHKEAWGTASRFSPIGQMFAEGVNIFGRGALTYYNPITKEWLYNAGFSTIYSLYVDFGLVGLVLYMSYQFILIIRFTRSYLQFAIFACVFLSFVTLNFALTDLTFVFSFNAILYLTYLRGRTISTARYKPSGIAPGRQTNDRN
ncbi:hypothetical protein TPR58_12895 [Sphingomonas sp. HF-S3]|uniref:Polysaccharide polymerase n=1 Tax=Sphingomonas rustica TaxID=3103142 RepID=A0ABV0BB18_9SPHN